MIKEKWSLLMIEFCTLVGINRSAYFDLAGLVQCESYNHGWWCRLFEEVKVVLLSPLLDYSFFSHWLRIV